jgi:hypothetical protein
MVNDAYRNSFLKAANAWVCDSYSLEIRYLVINEANQSRLWAAAVRLLPLPATKDTSFHIESEFVVAGEIQRSDLTKEELMQVLNSASKGQIDVNGHTFKLDNEQDHDYYSVMSHPARWFSDLHIQVSGDRAPLPSALNVESIDNALRRSDPPFDGLEDITAWLDLKNPRISNEATSVTIRVDPPIDLIIHKSSLNNDQLNLTLYAHPQFDVSQVGLAVRAVPGGGIESRKQVASEIQWKEPENGKREGIVQININQADSVLVMLMIANSCVRRQWFLDSKKARNNRLIATQHFDSDLRMIKKAVLEASNSDHFEKGIAALLYLLGFSPVLQVETDAPDIIVTTPGGQLVIVECTTRIADFNSKLGKLVDRRGSLSKALQASSHYFRVHSALVCGLPRDQIAAQVTDLEKHDIYLITREDLATAFNRLRFPNDPDQMLDNAFRGIT